MIKPELTERVDLEPEQDGMLDLVSEWDERFGPVDEAGQAEAVAAFDARHAQSSALTRHRMATGDSER